MDTLPPRCVGAQPSSCGTTSYGAEEGGCARVLGDMSHRIRSHDTLSLGPPPHMVK